MNNRMILADCSKNRVTWLEHKKSTIGSSEITTICGLNPFQSPLQLWAEKTGKVPPKEDNAHLIFGRLVEPAIEALFAHHTGLKVEDNDSMFVMDANPWASATPDAWVYQDDKTGLLECKYTSNFSAWQDNVPDSAHCQIIWQMGVVGCEWGYLAGLVGARPDDLVTPYFKFEQSIFDQLLERGHDFLFNYVKKDIAPEAKTSADSKLLDKLITTDKDKIVDLTGEALELANSLAEVQAKLKDANQSLKTLKEIEDASKARLMQIMADASKGILPDGRQVIIKQVNRGEYVVKPTSYKTISLKSAELPDVVAN